MKKRALCAAAAATVAVVGGVAPMAFAASGGVKGPEPKVTFCHHTSSETNPYVTITTARVALLNGHLRHGDALGVCSTTGGGGGGGGPEF
jgi:hypothetical protein